MGTASAALSVVDPHAAYPEGPLWRDGRVFYVEYAGAGVKMWDGHATHVFWQGEHCGPSGLVGYAGDHLLIACYDANSVVEIDALGHTVRTFDKDSAGKPFIGPNDFAPDGSGGVYFSASGVYDLKAPITGTVLHMSADGSRIVEVANTIHYSNGLTLSKDGETCSSRRASRAGSCPFPSAATAPWGHVPCGRALRISPSPRRTRMPTTVPMG